MVQGMVRGLQQRSLSSSDNIALDKWIDQFDLRVSLFERQRVDLEMPPSFYGSILRPFHWFVRSIDHCLISI